MAMRQRKMRWWHQRVHKHQINLDPFKECQEEGKEEGCQGEGGWCYGNGRSGNPRGLWWGL
eukprot:10890351-Karenia_brevis.AAC.1